MKAAVIWALRLVLGVAFMLVACCLLAPLNALDRWLARLGGDEP